MQQATPRGTPLAIPPPFSHVNDCKSSVGGGRQLSVGGARGGRGLSAAEVEINRLRANVKEAEARLEEERLVFSAVLEEERMANRRLREQAETIRQETGATTVPPVVHTTQGAILDRRFMAGITTSGAGGGGGGGRGRGYAALHVLTTLAS